MSGSIVVGIDASLTSTGLAMIVHGDPQLQVQTSRIASRLRGHDRLEEIISGVVRACSSADLVVLEGPSYGSKGSAVHQIAGLWWLLAHELWRIGRNVAICPPATRCLYATGKGNAPKDAVLAATISRYAHLTGVEQNDVADALVMAALGSRRLGLPIEQSIPQRHCDALAKVSWPELGAVVS